MDNATTHMCNEVEYLIQQAGAVLLYTAPYSPDLNPIEKMFNVYKAYLSGTVSTQEEHGMEIFS